MFVNGTKLELPKGASERVVVKRKEGKRKYHSFTSLISGIWNNSRFPRVFQPLSKHSILNIGTCLEV